MVYSPVMNAFRLSGPEAGGQPDYHDALMKGFAGAQQAAETVARPKNLAAALLDAQLKNKHQQLINQYLPRSEEARIGATESNTGLDAMRRQLMEAQVQKMNRPDAITGETAQLFALRNSLEGKDRDVVDAILARKAAGTSGTTVFDPTTGQPLVQIGGSSGGKAGGGTFLNPTTGEMTSQPTGATASNLQGRVIGGEALKPYLEKVVETIPQFQNPVTKASLYGEQLANALGGQNFPLPSQKAAGKAAIKEASEGMLKTFGLNATGANRQAMEDILKPRFGESPEGYANRVREQAATYAKNQELASSALRGGIKIGQTVEGKPFSETTPVRYKGKWHDVPNDQVSNFFNKPGVQIGK